MEEHKNQFKKRVATDLINVCVDDYKAGELSGRIYQLDNKQPKLFKDIPQLLKWIEERFEHYGGPQSATQNRTFVNIEHKKRTNQMEKKRKVLSSLDNMGKKSTFWVRVKRRQNSTWQGEVILPEQEVTYGFNSELDLIKIMVNSIERKKT